MNRENFLLIFEELTSNILNEKIIKNNGFEYNFQKLVDNTIICKFTGIDKNNKIVFITAKVLSNGETSFSLENENKDAVELSEKEFMFKYYSDYKEFKTALSDFEIELTNSKKNEKNIEDSGVESFKEKINIDSDKEKTIQVKNTIFKFKESEDDVDDLVEVFFELNNSTPQKDEASKYNVKAILKIHEKNSVPLKFILHDPLNEKEDKTYTQLEFKEDFNEAYNLFKTALDKYEKAYE